MLHSLLTASAGAATMLLRTHHTSQTALATAGTSRGMCVPALHCLTPARRRSKRSAVSSLDFWVSPAPVARCCDVVQTTSALLPAAVDVLDPHVTLEAMRARAPPMASTDAWQGRVWHRRGRKCREGTRWRGRGSWPGLCAPTSAPQFAHTTVVM